MVKSILIASLSIILSLFIGIFCLVRAKGITEFYRNHYASHRFLRSAAMFPFRVWWDSDYAETSIRLCGVLMISVAALLAFVMVRGLFYR